MELSSPRFKALAVAVGLSFWFFIISSAVGVFSIGGLVIFFIIATIIAQIFSTKLSRVLDVLAMINTKIFLGALFAIVISLYGIFFRILRIDLLRLRSKSDTYWLEVEQLKPDHIYKQY